MSMKNCLAWNRTNTSTPTNRGSLTGWGLKALVLAAIAALLATALLTACGPKGPPNLEGVDSFQDIHGLALKPDGDLFIATHHGLYLLKNDKDLYRVGKDQSDLMGFSMHPQNPDQVYASGHPPTGGNLGVMVSLDAGVSWRKIFSDVGPGAVDFHAMAMSLADPKTLYGWYEGKLYRTEDGGTTWKIIAAKGLSGAFTLATSPRNANPVFAGTSNGLLVSPDRGETWSTLAELGPVVAVAVGYDDDNLIYAFSAQRGMSRSADGGKTWQPASGGMDLAPREAILHVTIHPAKSAILYVGTTQDRLFKSEDGGQNWKRIK